MSAPNLVQTDVLVVGAGPVGLALAVELRRRDIAVRLVDRAPTAASTSRALGTQARTVEVFGMMGIPEDALVPSVRVRAVNLLDGASPLARIDIRATRPDRSYDGLLVMAQADTERVLTDRLQALGGSLDRGTELVDFAREDAGVGASLRTESGVETLHARFVVGCDGAHSTVRHRLAIPFAGKTYPQEFLLADCRIAWSRPPDEACIWLHPDGVFAAIPLPEPGMWRLLADVARPGLPSVEPSLDLFARLMTERGGVAAAPLSDATWMSGFTINRRLVGRYREGRVFLAGDAAHIHSPAGAQGMNTGIQDAFNLGWKLALAAQGRAAPGLLDTYGEERLPVAHGVLEGTDRGMRMAFARNPALRWARDRLIAGLADLGVAQTLIAEQISELGVNYRRATLSRSDAPRRDAFDPAAPRPGDRAPDGHALALPDGHPVSLFDLFTTGRWTLLLFAAPDHARRGGHELGVLARLVSERLGDDVRSLVVLPRGSSPEARHWPTPTLLDANGELAQRLGVRGEASVLVRPDGYLGPRASPVDDTALWAALGRVFRPDLLHDARA